MTPTPPSLRRYRPLARWLPFSHLDEQLAALLLAALALPLLALLVSALLPGPLTPGLTLAALLPATLAAAVFALWGLRQLLAPLRMAQAALQLPPVPGRVPPLPTDLGGDMGQLLRDLRTALESADRQRESLQTLSFDDPLTGLPNRRFAGEYLRMALHAAERTGARLSVALIDPEHIARLNEQRGTEAGDRAIRALGDFLRQWLKRKSDWVGRWQGDQFLAVMFSDHNQVIEYLENLKREFARQMQGFEDRGLRINLGIAELRKHESLQEFGERLESELRLEKCMQAAPPPAALPGSAKIYSLAAALRREHR